MTEDTEIPANPLLEAALALGEEARRRGAEPIIPASRKTYGRRDVKSGIQTAPHEFDRATVRALLCGPDQGEALGWVERHKANPSWLRHALSIEKGRVFLRAGVIAAITTAMNALGI